MKFSADEKAQIAKQARQTPLCMTPKPSVEYRQFYMCNLIL